MKEIPPALRHSKFIALCKGLKVKETQKIQRHTEVLKSVLAFVKS